MLCLGMCSDVCGSYFCFLKQKTAYGMCISDWSSDVCSSDLGLRLHLAQARVGGSQRGAVAQGFADQGVELRVAERGPPVAGGECGVAERRNTQAAAAGERTGFDRMLLRREQIGRAHV